MKNWTLKTTVATTCVLKKHYSRGDSEVTVKTRFDACEVVVTTNNDSRPAFVFQDTEEDYFPEYGLKVEACCQSNIISVSLGEVVGVDPRFRFDVDWDDAREVMPFFRRFGLKALDQSPNWSLSSTETWLTGPLELIDEQGSSCFICADDDGNLVEFSGDLVSGYSELEEIWWTIRPAGEGRCYTRDYYVRPNEYGQLVETIMHEDFSSLVKTADEEPPEFIFSKPAGFESDALALNILDLLPMNDIIWMSPSLTDTDVGIPELKIVTKDKDQEALTRAAYEKGGMAAVLSDGYWSPDVGLSEIWYVGPIELTNDQGFTQIIYPYNPDLATPKQEEEKSSLSKAFEDLPFGGKKTISLKPLIDFGDLDDD